MEVTFLGTGTSQGVPVIACKCEVCKSHSKFDKRLRSSVLISDNNINIVIDIGPDFRYQMLRANVDKLDASILTHKHRDHTAGIDDMRAFNWISKKSCLIYAETPVIDALKHDYAYSFEVNPYPGVPRIDFSVIDEEPFQIAHLKVIPIRGIHGKMPILGYRIGNFAYLTDFSYIETKEIEKLRGLEYIAVGAVQVKKHPSHFSLSEAVELIQEVKPSIGGYITHVSHLMGLYKDVNDSLPSNIKLAYDTLHLVM